MIVKRFILYDVCQTISGGCCMLYDVCQTISLNNFRGLKLTHCKLAATNKHCAGIRLNISNNYETLYNIHYTP